MFWGPWNISIRWGGANRVLGQVYAIPVLALVVERLIPPSVNGIPDDPALTADPVTGDAAGPTRG